MRSRTKKRLIILCAFIVMLAAGVVGLIKYKDVRKTHREKNWREDALQAIARGDFKSALIPLSSYVNARQDDIEMLEKFVDVRRKIVTPEHREITESLWALKILVKAKPSDIEIHRKMADIYFTIRHDTEASEHFRSVANLSKWTDLDSMRKLSASLARLRKWQECLDVTEKVANAAPTDLPAQIQRLAVMHELGKPDSSILKVAEKLRTDRPTDPRFLLLKAIALDMARFQSDPAVKENGQPVTPGLSSNCIRKPPLPTHQIRSFRLFSLNISIAANFSTTHWLFCAGWLIVPTVLMRWNREN